MASKGDRIFPLCELLLGAAYADDALDERERAEVRALLAEYAGEMRVEVEACIASFDPAQFDLATTASAFRDDPEEDRHRLLRLVTTVCEADDQLDFAENDYLRAVATALGLPASALHGLIIDIEEVAETFQAVRRGPPPVPSSPRAP